MKFAKHIKKTIHDVVFGTIEEHYALDQKGNLWKRIFYGEDSFVKTNPRWSRFPSKSMKGTPENFLNFLIVHGFQEVL